MRDVFARWEKEIGKKNTAKVVESLYQKRAKNDFTGEFQFTGSTRLIHQLETVGAVLKDSDSLTFDEKKRMLNIIAENLISKTLTEPFREALKNVLEKEFDQESWLEDEIDDIKSLLDEMDKQRELE